MSIDSNQHINNNITFINKKINIDELFEIYDIIDYCIPMRYHACLFSIYTNTPFLPIYTTRKINNLLLDINWLHSYKLDCNNYDIPITIDVDKLLHKFNNLVSYSKLIYDFKNEYDIAIKDFKTIIYQIILNKNKLADEQKIVYDNKTTKINLAFNVVKLIPGLYGYITISNMQEEVIIESDTMDYNENMLNNLTLGLNEYKLILPNNYLAIGEYLIYLNFTAPFSNNFWSMKNSRLTQFLCFSFLANLLFFAIARLCEVVL